MKYILVMGIFLCNYFFADAQHDMNNMQGMDKSKDKVKKTEQPATYTCTMHPEVYSTKPGNCPKCGMKLIQEKPATIKPGKEKNMEMLVKDSMINNSSMPKDSMKAQQHILKEKEEMQMGNMNEMPKASFTSIPAKYIINNDPPKVVHYDLYIKDTIVNFSGKSKRAIAVNGQIPMPTLTFTEGDTAEIVVYNELDEGTTLHWHGLFLDNQYDGVANLTQKPIAPHTSYVYRFPIKQHGTHWYHSHFGLQEQIGMYGSMILLSRKELDIPTIPLILSDWSDVKPGEIHRRLYEASDWFSIKKGTTQSYSEAIKSGHLKTKLTNEWKRMNAMDVSDVAYDKFLINGKSSLEYSAPLSFVADFDTVGSERSEVRSFTAGDKVRLRIANGGASSYFWLTWAGGKITVIANDGNDVVPVEVDRLIIGTSETYDVIVTIPQNKQYEFLVTPEDRTKYASLWLGSGEKIPAVKLPKLKYFEGMKMMNNMMDMKGNIIEMPGMDMQNQVMDMNNVMYPEITGIAGSPESPMMKMIEKNAEKKDSSGNNMKMKDDSKMQISEGRMSMMDMDAGNSDITTLNYAMLRSTEKTNLPEGSMRTLNFNLTGNMSRYVWTLDNKTVSETDRILIHKGENLRIIMFNNSMMRHPMHLHGHDFRLLNGQGDYAPLKNVIDIMPMERDSIEFAANESGGDWFFHCHILYHMMSGMGRIFSYADGKPNTEITDPKKMKRMLDHDDNRFHFMTNIAVQTNGSDGEAMLSETRWKINTLWHLGYHAMHGYESETMIGRYLEKMQWWFPYIGFDYHYKMEGMPQKNIFDIEHSPKNIFGNEEKNWFGQKSNKNHRHTIMAGITYTLPTLTTADLRVDGDGKFRFQLSREDIPVTPRLRFSWMINTDKEYMAGFRYIVNKYFSLGTHYDSDMGLGVGFVFTY